MSYSEDNFDRKKRNLIVISTAIIVYWLAGGEIKAESTVGWFHTSLSSPEVLKGLACIIFIYTLIQFNLARNAYIQQRVPSIWSGIDSLRKGEKSAAVTEAIAKARQHIIDITIPYTMAILAVVIPLVMWLCSQNIGQPIT